MENIKYKETGIPYCPQIPESWNVKRLKFVGQSIIGITYNPTQVTDAENGKLVLRSSNVQEGVLSFEDNVYVNSTISEKHLSKEGDILICARNGSAHLVGKCAYIPKEYAGLTFGAFMLMFRSEFGKYMYYVFNSNLFKSQTGLFKTSTINQLTSDTINNLFVALPNSVQTQQTIANYLDTKTTQIDTLIAKKQQLIQCLKEERTALINQAVTKGINPSANLKPSGIEWLGNIPKHWEVKRLASFGKFSKGGGFSKADLKNEGVLAILYGDIYTKYDTYIKKGVRYISDDKADNSVDLKKNDLLFTGSGETIEDIGKCVAFLDDNRTVAGGDVIIYRQVENSCIFLSYSLNSNGVKFEKAKHSKGQIIKHTYGSSLRNIYIPLPPLEEQTQIVKFIETQTTKIDKTIAKIETEISLIQEYKQALINEVVTGKKIVH